MGAYRQVMDEARGFLHEEMRVPALYFEWAAGGAVSPRHIFIRLYDKTSSVGGLKGTSYHFAEREDDTPKAQFWRSEQEPLRGAYISLSDGRVFTIDSTYEPDGLTRLTNLKRAPGDRDYPLPEAE